MSSFGKTFVNMRNSSDKTSYKFNAKKTNDETSYSYFGARYYHSDISIWLSVDPMADKYPGLSPYMYCAGNSIKLVDPNGLEPLPPIIAIQYLYNEKFAKRMLSDAELSAKKNAEVSWVFTLETTSGDLVFLYMKNQKWGKSGAGEVDVDYKTSVWTESVIGEMHTHVSRNAAPSASDIYGIGRNSKGRQIDKLPTNYVEFVVTKKTVFAIVVTDPEKYEAYRKKLGLEGMNKLYEEGMKQAVSAGNSSDYSQTLGGAKKVCGKTSETGISLYQVWNKEAFGKKSKWVKYNED